MNAFSTSSRLLLPLVLASIVPLSARPAAAQWTQFRGSHNGDGYARHADDLPVTWHDGPNGETRNVAWKTPLAGRAWSSPVVLDGQVWLTNATPDGHELFVVCLDLETGRVVHDEHLFHVEEPQEIHETNSHASPTPAVEPGRVYVHFGAYGTACLDARDASVIWARRDLPCNHWRGAGSSPHLEGDVLYLHYDGYDYQYVVALDKHTGDTIWRRDRDIDYGTDDGDLMKAYATPIIIEAAGRSQLISPAAKAAIAYDPATGEELWRVRYETHSTAARPVFAHGLVFISTGFSNAVLLAIRPDGEGDVTDSHVVWSARKGIGKKPSPIVVGDLIYSLNDRGTMVCMEALSGELVWEKRMPGRQYSASPIFADGRLYVFSEDGIGTVITPGRDAEIVAENRLAAGSMATPAAVGDQLIVRTETHVYCLQRNR